MSLSMADFIKQVSDEVNFLFDAYSYDIDSKDYPFAQWVLEMLFPGVDLDRAFNSLIPDTSWNINASYKDDESGTYYLIVAKYSEQPNSTVFGPGLVYGPLDTYTKLKNQPLDLVTVAPFFSEAANAVMSGYTLSIVLAYMGTLDDSIDLGSLYERYELKKEQLICLDIEKLRRRYSSTDQDNDIQDITLQFVDFATFSGPVDAVVGVITAREFKKSLQNCIPQIYDINLRNPLGTTKINKQIKATLSDPEKRKFFWYYNNGITMLCKKFTTIEGKTNCLIVESPSIVNGAQTTDTVLASEFSETDETALTIKLIAALPGTESTNEIQLNSSRYEDLYLDIARYTNSQNAIELPDFRSNEIVQKQLATKFSQLGWFYEHRRGTKPNSQIHYEGTIKMTDLAQTWFAFDGYPSIAIRQKLSLFEEQGYYGNIFMLSRSAEEYLSAYLLFQQIQIRLTNKIKQAKEKAGLATELGNRVPLDARNYLMIGHATKLAVASMTALIGKALYERYEGTLNRNVAKHIYKVVRSNSWIDSIYPDLEDTLFRIATQLQGEKYKTMHSMLSEEETLNDLYDLFKYVLEKESSKGRDPFAELMVTSSS